MASIGWTPVEDGSQLKDARLRLLRAHWSVAVKHGNLPSKEIVDPEKLGKLTDWLGLERFAQALRGSRAERRIDRFFRSKRRTILV
ncbi:MAG: hypothetical protein FJX54_12565 [Alphaproteobacteria bacterium]|nr:hypothetical protein [Alphaproteobacteria bacterium]